MYCSQCGNQLADKARFCSSCGASVQAQTDQANLNGGSEKPPSASQPRATNRLGRLWLWLSGALLVTAIFVALVLFMTSGLLEPAEQQLAAMRQGKIEAAYSFTSKQFRGVASVEQLRQFVTKYPVLSGHQAFAADERGFADDSGWVKGHLMDDEIKLAMIEFALIKEGDEWKIQGLTLNPPEG